MMPSTSPATPPPTTRVHSPGAGGANTPLAKRIASLVTVVPRDGPDLNNDELKAFIYAMHYKVENLVTWAKTVEEAIADHGTHIDVTTRRATNSFRLVEAETSKLDASLRDAAATAERDTRKVMELIDKNDVELKAKVSTAFDANSLSVQTLSTTMESRILQIESAIGGLRDAQAATAQAAQAAAVPDSALTQEVSHLKAHLLKHE